uniref:Uncharacterized protein n=1 Tax=Dipteran tombus-related virus TaxID=2822553 RepID=A0A8A6RH97_9TOMB|nr:hypothetical protein [Dipteran tombus-related virus]
MQRNQRSRPTRVRNSRNNQSLEIVRVNSLGPSEQGVVSSSNETINMISGVETVAHGETASTAEIRARNETEIIEQQGREIQTLRQGLEIQDLTYQTSTSQPKNELETLVDTVFLKCLYKTMDKDILQYIGAQITEAGRLMKIPNERVAKYVLEDQIVQKVLSRMSRCKTWNCVEEIEMANKYNTAKEGKLKYKNWWNPFSWKKIKLTDELGFQDDITLMDRKTSYRSAPTWVTNIGWVLIGCAAGYGIYRLYSHLTRTSITLRQTTPPTQVIETGIQQRYCQITIPVQSGLSTNTSGNLSATPENSVAQSMQRQLETQVKENTTWIMQMLSTTERLKSEIMSLPSRSLRKLEQTSTRHLDSFRQGMSHLISNTVDGLKRWKLISPNTIVLDTGSVKEIMTKLPEESLDALRDSVIQQRLITPNLTPTSPENTSNYLIRSIRLVTQQVKSYLICVTKPSETGSELIKEIGGKSMERGCQATSTLASGIQSSTTPS